MIDKKEVFSEKAEEFKPVPKWLCEKHPALSKFEVNCYGAVRTKKDHVYLWSLKENCHEFGYMQMQCYDKNDKECGWWLAKTADGWYMRPNNWRTKNKSKDLGYGGNYKWSKRRQIPLHRVVAAAWCKKDDGQDCVKFRDNNDRFNICADNLYWTKRGKDNAGNTYRKGARKFEWEDRFESMTAKEIVEDFAARGKKISVVTAYKYKGEHNNTSNKPDMDDLILAMYDPTLTQKKNVEKMLEAGLKVSQPKLSILLKYKMRKN